MSESLTLFLCLATAGISFWAFQKPDLRDRLLFRPQSILRDKEWYRLFSGALIHADVRHLVFNMLSLYLFGIWVEADFGAPVLALVYLASVAGGSLLSLYLHRFHEYSALGASGGVCGVVFAAIFLVPGLDVQLFLIPIPIPGPAYAICYLAWTFYALRRGTGNIGHDAHFGGALVGLLLAAVIAPRNCLDSPALFATCAMIAVAGLYVISRDPAGISGKIFVRRKGDSGGSSRDRDYDGAIDRAKEHGEMNRILDKISADGFGALTKKERATLDRMSEKNRR